MQSHNELRPSPASLDSTTKWRGLVFGTVLRKISDENNNLALYPTHVKGTNENLRTQMIIHTTDYPVSVVMPDGSV